MVLPRVAVVADDALSRDGFVRYVNNIAPNVLAAAAETCRDPDVILYTAENVDDEALWSLRDSVAGFTCPTVLVVDSIPHGGTTALAACRAVAILSRRGISAAALTSAIEAAAAVDTVRPDLDDLVAEAERAGVRVATLSVRESTVLRLISDGLSTAEVAFQLMYSEGTVKNVLHRLNERVGLRGRSHAVAYALRVGAI
jgi:DNA-binding NarL/FixJ family response regulator